MIGVEIKPVFTVDEHGNVIAPSGTIIVDRTQVVAPGVFYANVDLLNLVYHYGMQAAVTGGLIDRAQDRARAEAMREWLEKDEPPPEPLVSMESIVPLLGSDPDIIRAAHAARNRKLDVGPQCKAKGTCECTDGCGSCEGCGRWLGGEPERIKKR